jgi:hypothetical protein
MIISKNKVKLVIDAISVALNNENWIEEEQEILKQISDRASLCLHGDATGLEIDVVYAPLNRYKDD